MQHDKLKCTFFYFILYEFYADQKFKMAAITAGFILA